MTHQLPSLPFEKKALMPYISDETLDFHYGMHHAAYVNNLNKLIVGTAFENASLEKIIREATGGIYNNGAQVWNHTFYWNCLSPNGGGEPKGNLAKAITRDFGNFDSFKEKFTQAAATLFGSGWAWLVADHSGKLSIVQESNAGNPLRNNLTPILTCDVWEHAYYIDKRNKRPAYIEDFWKLVNWQFAEENYKF